MSSSVRVLGNSIRALALVAGLLWFAVSVAQSAPPAGAPAGATGLCKDGTYWTGTTKRGACHGHKGVKDWYGASSGAGASTGGAAAAAGGTGASTAAGTTGSAAPGGTPSSRSPSSASTESAAAGGGPGQVWVNTSSKVYHCPSDHWYGKTKHGEYMSESEAKAKGYRPDHGKACS